MASGVFCQRSNPRASVPATALRPVQWPAFHAKLDPMSAAREVESVAVPERDPVLLALKRAPRLDDDALSPEQWAAWDESIDELRSGCVQARAHEVVVKGLERHGK